MGIIAPIARSAQLLNGGCHPLALMRSSTQESLQPAAEVECGNEGEGKADADQRRDLTPQ